jgi:hypothetical protein
MRVWVLFCPPEVVRGLLLSLLQRRTVTILVWNVGMFLCVTDNEQGQGAKVRAASEKPLSWNDSY